MIACECYMDKHWKKNIICYFILMWSRLMYDRWIYVIFCYWKGSPKNLFIKNFQDKDHQDHSSKVVQSHFSLPDNEKNKNNAGSDPSFGPINTQEHNNPNI